MHTDNSADTNDSKESRSLTKKLYGIVAVAIIVITIVLSFYFSNFNYELSKDNADWGTFGDFVGGSLNPILSFLGLIALLYTIKLQSTGLVFTKRNLELTTRELELTRRELQSSSDALKEQAKTLAIQRFENTFFSLLKLHNEALDDIVASRVTTIIDSQAIEESIIERFSNELFLLEANCFISNKSPLSYEAFSKHLFKYSVNFESYFRALYHVLYFVTTHPDNDKLFSEGVIGETDTKTSSPMEKMYSELVKSLIVSDLIKVMAVSCWKPKSNSVYFKLKPLIERYCLLDTLPIGFFGLSNNLIDEIRSVYAPNAFGKAAE